MKSSTSISYTKKEIAFIILGIIAFIGMVLFLVLNEAKYCKQQQHVNDIIEAMNNNDTEKFLALIDDPQKSVDRANRSVLIEMFDIVFFLIAREAVPTTSPLEEACNMENLFYVEKLLEKGADPNHYQKDEQDPPLLIAVMRCNSKEGKINAEAIIEALLEHGADINIQNTTGENALFWLTFCNGNDKEREARIYKIAKLLIDNSIDKGHKDRYGKTAYDYAVKRNFPKYICDLLKP